MSLIQCVLDDVKAAVYADDANRVPYKHLHHRKTILVVDLDSLIADIIHTPNDPNPSAAAAAAGDTGSSPVTLLSKRLEDAFTRLAQFVTSKSTRIVMTLGPPPFGSHVMDVSHVAVHTYPLWTEVYLRARTFAVQNKTLASLHVSPVGGYEAALYQGTLIEQRYAESRSTVELVVCTSDARAFFSARALPIALNWREGLQQQQQQDEDAEAAHCLYLSAPALRARAAGLDSAHGLPTLYALLHIGDACFRNGTVCPNSRHLASIAAQRVKRYGGLLTDHLLQEWSADIRSVLIESSVMIHLGVVNDNDAREMPNGVFSFSPNSDLIISSNRRTTPSASAILVSKMGQELLQREAEALRACGGDTEAAAQPINMLPYMQLAANIQQSIQGTGVRSAVMICVAGGLLHTPTITQQHVLLPWWLHLLHDDELPPFDLRGAPLDTTVLHQCCEPIRNWSMQRAHTLSGMSINSNNNNDGNASGGVCDMSSSMVVHTADDMQALVSVLPGAVWDNLLLLPNKALRLPVAALLLLMRTKVVAPHRCAVMLLHFLLLLHKQQVSTAMITRETRSNSEDEDEDEGYPLKVSATELTMVRAATGYAAWCDVLCCKRAIPRLLNGREGSLYAEDLFDHVMMHFALRPMGAGEEDMSELAVSKTLAVCEKEAGMHPAVKDSWIRCRDFFLL